MRKIKFVVGKIYHVFNRGVEKRSIFLNDSDKWRFLQGMYLFNDESSTSNLLFRLERDKGAANFKTIKEFIRENPAQRKPLVKIMADCLMPNHFHLILEEIKEGGISNFMHKLGVGYVNYFNKKNNRVGGLFQGPFKAVPVEEDLYLKYLLIYLNVVNPGQFIEPELKEKGVQNIEEILRYAESYPWSTHQDYLKRRDSLIINKGLLGEIFNDTLNYDQFSRDVVLSKKFDAIKNLLLE